MSPGNLSLLSGPCLMKYCFRKHSPGLYFWYVPGNEITCRWLYQFIRSQFSASMLPCARTTSTDTKRLFSGFYLFGLQAGQKLMLGSWLQVLAKYWIYVLWETTKFHCCRINEFKRLWLKHLEKVMWELLFPAPRQFYMLQWFTPGSVISIAKIARNFVKYKLWFL